ncbi:nuclear transport factor 2 family protein [Mesorhizobium sp. A623]
MKLRCLSIVSTTLLLSLGVAFPSFADEAAVIERWYKALLIADRAGLSDLLSADARIKLTDLNIEQDKQEFIASMDEWQASAKGATIRHRLEKSEDGVSTVIVCYEFPNNDLLTQETFAVTGERITASSQAIVAENCDAF